MYNFDERLKCLSKLGIDIRVLNLTSEIKDGNLFFAEVLSPKNNSGLLIMAEPNEEVKFGVVVDLEKNSELIVFEVSGKNRNITLLGNKSPSNSATKTFIKRVRTHPDKTGCYTTKNNAFQNNGLWVAKIGPKSLEMWEIAIVTQIQGLSKYYLSLQKVYCADLYENNGEIFVPEEQFLNYNNWQSLNELVKKCVNVEKLTSAKNYSPPNDTAPELEPNKCQIQWFNQSRRYGLGNINGHRGPVMIHSSEILDQEFPALDPGTIVSFDKIKRTPQGLQLQGVKE
ncbi:MAG: hypothetical protein COV29_04255 [Candidatus Yanofskybacteria bacterium CG10_big_fil_rev_8_21_14_0_10_36_16]|uniref:Uncharacterized protein n=1 Tax=Candidatus Yanofskybacteria bacterium CG10_big_fil_rev_8_21_14_0_10_36_16 TaxID=1975096 RepID=A0A2J0Q6E0_9BACT|nr:MAG: hypothetical protein COV29_04255 [Candidatus Yanofskybacteria bacterium CG10_big_fil_rev_8_21_14_0_10_36_16]